MQVSLFVDVSCQVNCLHASHHSEELANCRPNFIDMPLEGLIIPIEFRTPAFPQMISLFSGSNAALARASRTSRRWPHRSRGLADSHPQRYFTSCYKTPRPLHCSQSPQFFARILFPSPTAGGILEQCVCVRLCECAYARLRVCACVYVCTTVRVTGAVSR